MKGMPAFNSPGFLWATVKGKIGRSLGDRKMKNEGDAERARGQIQEGFGKSKRKVGEAVKKIGKAIGK